MRIKEIKIRFPLYVELPKNDWQERLVNLIDEVCDKYEKENPKRVMWPFGFGGDEDFLIIEVAEREDFYNKNNAK